MSSSAGRRMGAWKAASWCVLLVSGLLLAACGGDAPRLSMPSGPTGSQPRAQAQTPAPSAVPVPPTPLGNVNSSGSIGPEIQSVPTLPPAPTGAATQPPATQPPGQATQAPAPPAQATPVPGGGSS